MIKRLLTLTTLSCMALVAIAQELPTKKEVLHATTKVNDYFMNIYA